MHTEDMYRFFQTQEGADLIKKRLERSGKIIDTLTQSPYARNVIPPDLDFHAPLYRIEKFEHFAEAIAGRSLHFSHPTVWLKDDEKDSVLLCKRVVLSNGTLCRQEYFDETFCQCWSTGTSDQMWKEYGRDSAFRNVMLVSSIHKLMNALEQPDRFDGYSEAFWAVKINYSNFEDDGSPIVLSEKTQVAFFTAALIASLCSPKRKRYSKEKEIRLVANFRKADKGKGFSKVSLQTPLGEILSGVILDPRSKSPYSDEMVAYVQNNKISLL